MAASGSDSPPPSDAPDPFEEARELLAAGKVEEARAIYSHALAKDQRNMKAREGIAACATAAGHKALREGDIDAAVSHYQKALEIVPFHPAADDGLRRAAAMAKERSSNTDPLLAAIDRLPPVVALREARIAERVIARATGLPRPSALVMERLESRHLAMANSGAAPREQRVAAERERAWARRWVYRSLPAGAIVASLVLVWATGDAALLAWGLILALFALCWDVMFVEGRKAS